MIDMNEIIDGVIRTLRREWSRDIWEPRTVWIQRANDGREAPKTLRWSKRIELYFRAAGGPWSRTLDKRDGRIKYRPATDAWCGMFAGYGFANPDQVPVRVHPEISKRVFPSTYRLNSRKFWKAAGFDKLESRVWAADIQRGDIVTVRTRRNDPRPWGDHIVVALGPASDGEFPTIEGNAYGNKPSGEWARQGVVIRTRPLSDVRRVYRLRPEHFTSK